MFRNRYGSALWALSLMALCAAGPARASDIQLDLHGRGVLTAEGRQSPVTDLSYVSLEQTQRTSYSVTVSQRTLTFTGLKEVWPDKTHALLTLDGVLSLARDGVKDLPATGTCQMEASRDLTVVRLVLCQATTTAGPYSLRFELGEAP